MIIKSVRVTILEDTTQISNYMTTLVSKKWRSYLLRLLQDHVRIIKMEYLAHKVTTWSCMDKQYERLNLRGQYKIISGLAIWMT